MFFKHIPVIKYPCCIRYIRDAKRSFRWNNFQCFQNIFVRILNFPHHFTVGNIRQNSGIHIIRIIDIPANSDNIRIVLPDKPCPHNGRSIVWRINGQMDIIVCCIEFLFHLVKIGCCFRFVLQNLDFCLPTLFISVSARSEEHRRCHTSGQSSTDYLFPLSHHFFSFLVFVSKIFLL